jgi:hypothetical protein
MRRSLACLAILAAVTANAADERKPGKLTPEEIMDGWISLFDSETTFGWMTSGPVHVDGGELVLGGTQQAIGRTTTEFGEVDYRLDYSSDSKAGVEFIHYGQGTGQRTMSGKDASGFDTSTHKSPTGEFNQKPTPFVFTIPAGATFKIRGLKVRPLGLMPIFNGKDLSGWKKYTGDEKRAKSDFTVTPEGWINVKNGAGDLQTEKQWADFVFQGECISNGPGLNSGVFFRCLPGQYQQGYEFQIQNGFKNNDRTKPADFGTGAIYRRVPARKVVSDDGKWFTMTLIAKGNHIATWVNGYQTVDWTDTRPANDNARNGCKLGPGPISLQGHDKTTDLSFRNLRIAELKKKE